MYFLECVICYNNIYKNRNNEISGNLLEQEIFEILKSGVKKSVSREKETNNLFLIVTKKVILHFVICQDAL